MLIFKHAFLLSLVSYTVSAASSEESGYVITLKPGLSDRQAESHYGWIKSQLHVAEVAKYHINTFRAYSGKFDQQAINKIKSRPEVQTVELDVMMTSSSVMKPKIQKQKERTPLNTELMMTSAPSNKEITQKNAPWGLSRLSSLKTPGFFGKKSYDYTYHSSAGEGTWAYVLDDGINLNHQDFGRRVTLGAICYNDTCTTPSRHRAANAYHGTHVAGTIAGSKYGVAKKAKIVDVRVMWDFPNVPDKDKPRVLKQLGFLSTTLNGLTWAFNDMRDKHRIGKSVINLSLGPSCPDEKKTFDECKDFAKSYAVKYISQALFKAGILVIAAAGNQGLPAEWRGHHGQDGVLTVGAIDEKGNEAPFSNYGEGVDILAPGVGILSADFEDVHGGRLMSGTSMATPHVTGLALYLMALEGITDPGLLKKRILDLAVDDGKVLSKGVEGRGKGKLRKPPTTKRRAYNGIQKGKPRSRTG
ncbi:hypothetical protein CP532_0481 [Ophiocordyceps camponoti-leonardi (nom. inval.)]|nr:hypothetical protein CP532_0481 [Ophiocordyceps camponoti-leonardi (nom. inval.)]